MKMERTPGVNNAQPPVLRDVRPENALNFDPPHVAELKKFGSLFLGSFMIGLGVATVKMLGTISDSRAPLPFYIFAALYFCHRVPPVLERVRNILRNEMEGQLNYTSIAKFCAVIVIGLVAGYAFGRRRY
jgi:hypothetical protein